MNETLVCESCNKTWKREVTRGRKPKLCKKCFKDSLKTDSIKKESAAPVQKPVEPPAQKERVKISYADVFKAIYTTSIDSKKLIDETKNGSQWKCSRCGATLEVHVPLSDIPTHKCGISSRVQNYERVL